MLKGIPFIEAQTSMIHAVYIWSGPIKNFKSNSIYLQKKDTVVHLS